MKIFRDPEDDMKILEGLRVLFEETTDPDSLIASKPPRPGIFSEEYFCTPFNNFLTKASSLQITSDYSY